MELVVCVWYVVGAMVCAFLIGRFLAKEMVLIACFWPVLLVLAVVLVPLYSMAHLGDRLRGRNASKATDDQV